jgi:hypothetical protein
MKYPSQLLPQYRYKNINCNIDNFHLIRHIDPKEGDTVIDSETGNIKLKYIADPTKHIADYSTSLLSRFKIQHIKIALTSEGKNLYNFYCFPNRRVKKPIYDTDFCTISNRQFFTIKISSLNRKHIFFETSNGKDEAQCVIEHTPMRWNFWHFSVRWKHNDSEYLHEQEEKLFSRPTQGWIRVLSTTARAMLVHHARINNDNYEIISKKCYKNIENNSGIKKLYIILKFP